VGGFEAALYFGEVFQDFGVVADDFVRFFYFYERFLGLVLFVIYPTFCIEVCGVAGVECQCLVDVVERFVQVNAFLCPFVCQEVECLVGLRVVCEAVV